MWLPRFAAPWSRTLAAEISKFETDGFVVQYHIGGRAKLLNLTYSTICVYLIRSTRVQTTYSRLNQSNFHINISVSVYL